MAQAISTEKKQQIIHEIRDEGNRVVDVSVAHGISTKTIYHWLRDGITDGSKSLILENRRLKQENEQLYRLLGRATAELNRPKS